MQVALAALAMAGRLFAGAASGACTCRGGCLPARLTEAAFAGAAGLMQRWRRLPWCLFLFTNTGGAYPCSQALCRAFLRTKYAK